MKIQLFFLIVLLMVSVQSKSLKRQKLVEDGSSVASQYPPAETNPLLEQQPDEPNLQEDGSLDVDSKEDDSDDDLLRKNDKANGPSHSFFPITFGKSVSGLTAAISNSFSAGKKGAANSQATAKMSGNLVDGRPPFYGMIMTSYTYDKPTSNCPNCGRKVTMTPIIRDGQSLVLGQQITIPDQSEDTETPSAVEPTAEESQSDVLKTVAQEEPRLDSDEDDDDDLDLFNFFPISFGGGSSGGLVAIANSFNTGKKGVASSLATANGAPGNYTLYSS